MTEITCFCEKPVPIDYRDTYDLDAEPALIEELLSGSFLNVTCEACGTVLKPEFPIRFIRKSKNLDMFLVPESERNLVLGGKCEYTIPGRCAVGYHELVEKIKIYDRGLNEETVEFVKFYILEKLEKSDSVGIFFNECDGEHLEFHIQGLRKNEIGISKIPIGFYNEVSSNYDNIKNDEPFSIIRTEPYISVTKIDL